MAAATNAPATWPMLTINILAFNRRDEVRITLIKLLHEPDYPRERLEIIVVDNASTDGTSEMVRREFPTVRLITNGQNTGIAGWNRGFASGTGEYFLVLDDDSAPLSGLKAAVQYLEAHPHVGILACKIVGGAYILDQLKPYQEWIGFIGAGAIIRKDVIATIGGYAPWMFVYAHEWEYGIRCLDQGYKIVYFDDCVVEHRVSSVNRTSKRLASYTTRNELLIVYKYFSQRRLLLLWRTFVYNAYKFSLVDPKAFWYVVNGAWLFLRAMPQQDRQVVAAQVQALFADEWWPTKPVMSRMLKAFGRRVGGRMLRKAA